MQFIDNVKLGDKSMIGHAPHGDCVPSALWPCSSRELAGMGHQRPPPWASHREPWPSGPLWPWAAVRSGEIVDFFISLWSYSNEIQIHFGLNLDLSKFVQTEYLNEVNPSL
jgi:hypothetical protein